MTTSEQPLPSGGPHREKLALHEVEHTTIAPATTRLLLVVFLGFIALVPLLECAFRLTGVAEETSPWTHLWELPGELRVETDDRESIPNRSGLWHRITGLNRITIGGLGAFEHALDEDSLLAQRLRPPAQVVITGWLGAGNELVYPGRDGWLFYRPDVEYITGAGFLDATQLDRRIRPTRGSAANTAVPAVTQIAGSSESTRQESALTQSLEPDPRKAIAQFRRDLEARGIALVVVPTPVKPGVHPEHLTRGGADVSARVLQNPSYRALVQDLSRDGVLVFDPSEALAASRLAGPQYLATDSHWRPEAMESVAELLGSFIGARVHLPDSVDPGFRVERPVVQNLGDGTRMLDMPEHFPLFPSETASLRRILQPDGSPWRPSRDGDVLLLGDSFTNIYSLDSMGWGTSAGFAEQLSYALRRHVDRLTQNDEGAFATRAMLQRDPARLAGKRVVIYQFAARELAFGNWKVLPLGEATAQGAR